MHTAFVLVSVLAAAALTFSATADFVRYEKVLVSMTRAAVPEPWLKPLGADRRVAESWPTAGLPPRHSSKIRLATASRP